MLTPTIGVRTRSLGPTLRRGLASAERMGADGVQLDLSTEMPLAECSRSAIRELNKRLDDRRLRVASAMLPTRRPLTHADQFDRRVAAVMQAMGVASALGSRTFVMRVGPIPSDEQSPPYTHLVETLIALAAHGDRVGARPAFCVGLDSAADVRALLGRLPDGIAGADLQPAPIAAGGAPPAGAAESLGGRVLHVTAGDSVPDADGVAPRAVPIGRGTVDYPQLLAELDRQAFGGWLTIAPNVTGAPAVGEAADAVAYLRRVARDS